MWPRPKLAEKRVVIPWPGKRVFSQAISELVLSAGPRSPDSPGSQMGGPVEEHCCSRLPRLPLDTGRKREKVVHPSRQSECNGITGNCSQALQFPCRPTVKTSAIMHSTWCSGISISSWLWRTSYTFLFQWFLSVCLCWQPFISSSAFPYFFHSFCPFFFCLQCLLIMLLNLLPTSCECTWKCVVYLTKRLPDCLYGVGSVAWLYCGEN